MVLVCWDSGILGSNRGYCLLEVDVGDESLGLVVYSVFGEENGSGGPRFHGVLEWDGCLITFPRYQCDVIRDRGRVRKRIMYIGTILGDYIENLQG